MTESRGFRARDFDPAFASHEREIETLSAVAWQACCDGRNSPRTRKAAPASPIPIQASIAWQAHQAASEAASQALGCRALERLDRDA